jgi:hypothetical protein
MKRAAKKTSIPQKRNKPEADKDAKQEDAKKVKPKPKVIDLSRESDKTDFDYAKFLETYHPKEDDSDSDTESHLESDSDDYLSENCGVQKERCTIE